jgi:aspartokinase-like uncharacterized kinase
MSTSPAAAGSLPLHPVAGWQFGWLLPPTHRSPGSGCGVTLKVGGSLLSRPDWPSLLAPFLAAHRQPVHLVVGGGEVVEGLRRMDAAVPQPAERMHRLAIGGMSLTAQLVAEVLGLALLRQPDASQCVGRGVIEPTAWLQAGRFAGLPASWDVTSDALAAVVAATLGEALVLVKRCPPPAGGVAAATAAGWIDSSLEQVSNRAGVAWATPVNSVNRC